MAPSSRPSATTITTTRDSRWLALVVPCAGMLMIVLDATIVNVALPSIRSDYRLSFAIGAGLVLAPSSLRARSCGRP